MKREHRFDVNDEFVTSVEAACELLQDLAIEGEDLEWYAHKVECDLCDGQGKEYEHEELSAYDVECRDCKGEAWVIVTDDCDACTTARQLREEG